MPCIYAYGALYTYTTQLQKMYFCELFIRMKKEKEKERKKERRKRKKKTV